MHDGGVLLRTTAPPPLGSRFRGIGDPGVWYGADVVETALAEVAYWRLRFLADSPATPDLPPVPHTAFRASIGGSTIDLRAAPFDRQRRQWEDPNRYDATQALARNARDAGLSRIDHLLVSHYHADHFGGVMELAQLLPIAEYIDHAKPSADAEARVPGTLALYDAYVALRSKAKHRAAKAGDRFAVGDAMVDVVASDGVAVTQTLADAGPEGGKANAACTTGGVPPQEPTENPQSTAILLHFGAFRYLDVGDLSGAPLYALTCPVNRLGLVDAYAIAHHGGDDGSDPSLYAAVRPTPARQWT